MSNGLIDLPVASPSVFATRGENPDSEPASPLLPRSASYTDLKPEENPGKTESIRRSYSENVLANTIGQLEKRHSAKNNNVTTTTVRPRESLTRKTSAKRRSAPPTHSKPRATVPKFSIGPDEGLETAEWESNPPKEASAAERQWLRRSISGSISNFARRSWVSSSRSPSPSASKRLSRYENSAAANRTRSSSRSRSAPLTKSSDDIVDGATNGHTNGIPRRDTVLRKKSRRPLSAILGNKEPIANIPSVPAIPKSFSTDKLPSLSHKRSMLRDAPTLPPSSSSERLQGSGYETPRKRDELWGVFRSLDGDFHKFQSRPSTSKTSVVRSTLLPFLRMYAEHPSTLNLRPEDLDRRTVILNKWWTGLLEMLNGRHGESVSGNDRPAVLEAVTALMIRPEWTLTPSIPLRSGRTMRSTLKSRSTTSLGSSMSEFLVDSVFHNVRNTFTQNLLAQMAYVVDKMSGRNVAASVVTFCGKATAYAFFYCEGVAEILVRLWNLSSETVRRVLVEHGLQRNITQDFFSQRISASFPPCLQSLTFKAIRPMMMHLRTRPHLPIATSYIPWHGPWTGRWAGRDTDLFFVFVKFYMDLACRQLPDNPSLEERIAAPGWVLVHAQLLTVLDATMQRINSQTPIDHVFGPSSLTFDEMLGEADAAATVLPLAANGLGRSMAENRLIMLLRDCLSNSAFMGGKAQMIFAETFSILLKATARRTSVFDHNACFTLCDFLEEAMGILVRYHQASGTALAIMDWQFWLDVYKRMLESHNSMTDVRLCAFLYSTWGLMTDDEEKKREICIGWLLTKETFQKQFNHWCPMVRAFYMRLLIWRVARSDRGGSEVDKAILETLSSRLEETWCHYLYLQESAERNGLAAPSTAPCSPAPCRCLVIVRDDLHPAPSGMFLSFEGILSSSSSKKANPYEKHGSQDPFSHPTSFSSSLDVTPAPNTGKRRWGLLRSILPFSNPTGDSNISSTNQKSKSQNSTDLNPHGRPESRDRSSKAHSQLHEISFNPQANRNRPAVSTHRSLSFKFSLEWIEKENTSVGRERRLHPPKLPLPAQLSFGALPVKPFTNEPREPEGFAAGPSKYAGRALAEWTILIIECQKFFDRRKAEGVPTYHLVETPTLGVDPFRKT